MALPVVQEGLGVSRARWGDKVERVITEPRESRARREKEGDDAASNDCVHTTDKSRDGLTN